ncbi:MAG TPA: energy transducer TonB [Blastocatellia bacterium]|nr:energy transducer TonB [Blastocatellia bacterium]
MQRLGPIEKDDPTASHIAFEVIISEQGEVMSARFISGNLRYKQDAIETVMNTRFEPKQLRGVPVKVIGTITYRYDDRGVRCRVTDGPGR